MKTLLSTAAIAATLISASAFASDSQYKLDVFNLADSALVKVTQNGQPVEGANVQVKGLHTRNMSTSENGTVIIRNTDNAAHSFTISVTEPNGEVISTERFISQYE